MIGIIYKATSPSGKCYIGQTIKLEDRKISHKWCSFFDNKNNKEYDLSFHRAIRKYGFDNIKWEIVYENIPEHLLDIAEICSIYLHDSYYNGYNETLGGDGVGRGESHPLFGKIGTMFGKVGSWRGKKNPDHSERMRGFGNPMFGKKRKDRTEMNLNRKGTFTHSQETKEKMSKSRKGKPKSEQHKANMRHPHKKRNKNE